MLASHTDDKQYKSKYRQMIYNLQPIFQQQKKPVNKQYTRKHTVTTISNTTYTNIFFIHLFPGQANETLDETNYTKHREIWEDIQGKPYNFEVNLQKRNKNCILHTIQRTLYIWTSSNSSVPRCAIVLVRLLSSAFSFSSNRHYFVQYTNNLVKV